MSVTREPDVIAGPAPGRRWSLRPSSVLGTISVCVLAVALPAYLVGSVADAHRSDAWVLTLGVMVWAGLRLSQIVMRGRPHLFDMFFWLFTYIFMGLAPTVQIRSDQTPGTTPGMDAALDLPAALIVVLGLVTYEVGRLVAVRRDASDLGATNHRATLRPVSARHTAVLVAISALVAAYFVSKVGFVFFEGTRDAGAAAREAAFPDPTVRAIFQVASLFPVVVALGALIQLRSSANPVVRRRVVVAAVLCVALIFSVVSPVSSARYTFGTVAFALVVYAGALTTPARVRATMIATFLGLLFVFPIADAFRRVGQAQTPRGGFFNEYVGNPDYDAFWQVANAYSYWRDGLVEPLRQYLGSAFFWLPRSIWSNKPTDTGILLADYRGYSFDNLSAPLWAEALVNGGIVAVVLTFVLFGYWMRRLDIATEPSTTGGGAWLLVAAILPVYSMILLRGSLLQATGGLIVAIVCIAFVRGRRSGSPGPSRSTRSATGRTPAPQDSYSDSS